jgi:RNA recognition motif-containing protein
LPVRLFVGNLPYGATDLEVREHFSAVGPPLQVVMPVDRETGRPRGFAFVEFADRVHAEEAIRRFDGQPFKGRSLSVSEARARDARPPADRPPPVSRTIGSPPPAFDDAARRPGVGRERTFGPDATPARKRRGPARSDKERGPKGPIRERGGGRIYSVTDDDVQDEELQATGEELDATEDFARSLPDDETAGEQED